MVARLVLAARAGGALRFYDERDYHAIALHLLAGAGFSGEHGPTAFRAPGQPLVLASVYAGVGAHPLAALALALRAVGPMQHSLGG